MKKKLLVLLLALALVSTAVFGGDWRYVFGDLDQHPEILIGFVPSYTTMGVGYSGLSLIPGNRTELQFLTGGGYSQRKVWQDPNTGSPITTNPLIYDVWRVEWLLKFTQGFGHSWVPNKDLVTAYVGYEGRWEDNVDSMVTGKTRSNGGVSRPVASISDWFLNPWAATANAIYPDLTASTDGRRMMLGTTFQGGVKLDMMRDLMTSQDGFLADLNVKWAPLALNRALDGEADYYSVTLNAVGAWTPYQLKSDDGSLNLFAITLVDRFNVNWTDGRKVPVYAQGGVSLGRKVRGFTTWSYNTRFTMVNNFDVRFAGPEPFFNGLYPRINLFFDIGYGAGAYFNSSVKPENGYNLLCSTGVQFTVSIFDFIDLGYQLAYIIDGMNYAKGVQAHGIVGSVTFFLDF